MAIWLLVISLPPAHAQSFEVPLAENLAVEALGFCERMWEEELYPSELIEALPVVVENPNNPLVRYVATMSSCNGMMFTFVSRVTARVTAIYLSTRRTPEEMRAYMAQLRKRLLSVIQEDSPQQEGERLSVESLRAIAFSSL